jgi:hypothetical protein
VREGVASGLVTVGAIESEGTAPQSGQRGDSVGEERAQTVQTGIAARF